MQHPKPSCSVDSAGWHPPRVRLLGGTSAQATFCARQDTYVHSCLQQVYGGSRRWGFSGRNRRDRPIWDETWGVLNPAEGQPAPNAWQALQQSYNARHDRGWDWDLIDNHFPGYVAEYLKRAQDDPVRVQIAGTFSNISPRIA